MNKLTKVLADYQTYHTKKITVITHFFGVPLVMFALMIMLGWVKIVIPNLFATNASWIVLFFLMVYYFRLTVGLAAITTIFLVILCFIASYCSQYGPTNNSLLIFFSALVSGVTLQLIGHYFEHNKPAVLNNFAQIFIGPMFIMAEFLFLFGYRHDLKISLKNELIKRQKNQHEQKI